MSDILSVLLRCLYTFAAVVNGVACIRDFSWDKAALAIVFVALVLYEARCNRYEHELRRR